MQHATIAACCIQHAVCNPTNQPTAGTRKFFFLNWMNKNIAKHLVMKMFERREAEAMYPPRKLAQHKSVGTVPKAQLAGKMKIPWRTIKSVGSSFLLIVLCPCALHHNKAMQSRKKCAIHRTLLFSTLQPNSQRTKKNCRIIRSLRSSGGLYARAIKK